MSMETATAAKSDLPLYQEIAGQVIHLIDRGTFRPGDRISSVRGLSRQKSVRITTVLEAYRLLEDSGSHLSKIASAAPGGSRVNPRE